MVVVSIIFVPAYVQSSFAAASNNDVGAGGGGNEEPEFCEPSEVEGRFDNCTDPVCEPGQV